MGLECNVSTDTIRGNTVNVVTIVIVVVCSLRWLVSCRVGGGLTTLYRNLLQVDDIAKPYGQKIIR